MKSNLGTNRPYINPTRHPVILGFFLTSTAMLYPSTTGAQESADIIKQETKDNPDSVFQLGTITVYGQALSPSDALESRIDSATITLLEKKNVAEALSMTPGVTFVQGAGGRNESFALVRGFGSLLLTVSPPMFLMTAIWIYRVSQPQTLAAST